MLAALGTLASYTAPELTGWHDDSPISREVFGGIPEPVVVAFYLTIATMLMVVAWLVSLRVRNYERGQPDDRRLTKQNANRRVRDFRAGVWMQTLLRDPAAGVMHSLIYFGFLVLFAVTIILEVDHQLPERPEVPPRHHLPGVLVRGRPLRPRVPRRHPVGDRPPLPAAAVPDPHQVEARARRDPRSPSSRSPSPASSPRRSASPSCASWPGRAPTTRSGRSSAGASPARRLVDRGLAARRAPVGVGRARRHVRRLPRDPADHDAAPHDHVAGEHVPARTSRARRAR